MNITLEFTRFKDTGTYYDTGLVTVSVDDSLLALDTEHRGKLFHEMHTNILPKACAPLTRNGFILVINNDTPECDVIGFPYMMMPANR